MFEFVLKGIFLVLLWDIWFCNELKNLNIFDFKVSFLMLKIDIIVLILNIDIFVFIIEIDVFLLILDIDIFCFFSLGVDDNNLNSIFYEYLIRFF